MLSGELGVFQAFLAHWYIGGGYMDVSEVFLYINFCDLKMAHSGRNMSSSA